VDEEQAYLALRWLRPLVTGRDPLATEHLWDLMARVNRHGRTGYFMAAVSAVDEALWDLKGRHVGEPVYRLLGGPTRDRVRAYGSMLGASVEPERAAAEARRRRDEGFTAQKWFFRHGPGSGEEGVGWNLALAAAVREGAGDDAEIMFDAYMGWTADYAVRTARGLLPYRPAWLEEPFPPNRLDAFRRLKAETGIPIATGEHVYTRWEFRPFLDEGLLAVVQADPDWTGGVTELARVADLASAYGVRLVPHGHSIAAALHVVASRPPATCPMVEYLFSHLPRLQYFHKRPITAEGGWVALPTAPGLGIELDEAKIESREELSW
jgi:L-alanine-DL-glutamate epimerase-like enolase superfamily enzyme